MQDDLMSALEARRPQIRGRWEALLRVERANSPLANPDALVHLLDWTIDEVFRTLQTLPSRRRPLKLFARDDVDCPCGRNPLLHYFAAGEQALQESLVFAQSESAHFVHLDPLARDSALNELNLAVRHIARREIQAFCALCQLRERSLASAAKAEPNHAHAHEHVPAHAS
jgi:hypothetical protein